MSPERTPSERPTLTSSSAPRDPVAALLETPDLSARHAYPRHWLVIIGLALVVLGAAFFVPELLEDGSTTDSRTAPALSVPPTWPASSTPVTTPSGPQQVSPSRSAASTSAPTGDDRPTTTGRRPTTPPPAATTGPASKKAAPAASAETGGGFRPILRQAESPWNTLSEGAQLVDCSSCRGGSRVRYIGRLDMPVRITEAGTRTVTVVWEAHGTRTIAMRVNGGPLISRDVSGDDWAVPQAARFRVRLPAGQITLSFISGPGTDSPDIDALAIS